MSPLAQEWVEKAEADLTTASRELGVVERPNYDAVCFLAQQCAEKYLKGVLEQNRTHVPKTHDLGELLDLALNVDPSMDDLRELCDRLEGYAVDFRYPGESASKAMAEEAVEAAREVRAKARALLGLEP